MIQFDIIVDILGQPVLSFCANFTWKQHGPSDSRNTTPEEGPGYGTFYVSLFWKREKGRELLLGYIYHIQYGTIKNANIEVGLKLHFHLPLFLWVPSPCLINSCPAVCTSRTGPPNLLCIVTLEWLAGNSLPFLSFNTISRNTWEYLPCSQIHWS